MKILLDSCIWGKARLVLEAAGHSVEWTGDWERDPGDEEILQAAFRSGSVLVTQDKDFGELAIIKQQKHSGILRLVDFSALQQGPAIAAAMARYGQELMAGAIVTVDPTRVRVRPPEQT